MSKEQCDPKRGDRRARLVELVKEAKGHLEAAGHERLELEPGAIAVLQPGEMLLVDEGFFHLDPVGGDGRTARAPTMAGLLEESVGQPTAVKIEALKATRGFRFAPGVFYALCKQDEFFRRLRYGLYEYELAVLHLENRAYRKHLHDFYAPGGAALLPGPYQADDVQLVGMLMETQDRRWAKRLLPPGVWRPPGLRNKYLIVMAHFRNVTCKHPLAGSVSFDYRETTVFIPAVAGFRPGAFAPILFPDNAMAITLGREIYGFPKRFGRTQLDFDQRYAELEVDDKLQFWCEWDEEQPLPTADYVDKFVEAAAGEHLLADKAGDVAGWFFQRLFTPDRDNTWPAASVFVRKQLPDVALPCEKDLVYERDNLVRVPFDVSDFKSCALLPNLRYEPGRRSSFLPESRCVIAGHVTADMGFGVRQELHDFLGPIDHARLMHRRFKRTAQHAVSRTHGMMQLTGDVVKEAYGKISGGSED